MSITWVIPFLFNINSKIQLQTRRVMSLLPQIVRYFTKLQIIFGGVVLLCCFKTQTCRWLHTKWTGKLLKFSGANFLVLPRCYKVNEAVSHTIFWFELKYFQPSIISIFIFSSFKTKLFFRKYNLYSLRELVH